MHVLLQYTKIILVFDVDSIIFNNIKLYANKLVNMFSFKQFQEPKTNLAEYRYIDGFYLVDNNKVLITDYSITARKMVLTTNGKTEETENIMNKIINFLHKHTSLNSTDFLFKTYETTTVVKLDFSIGSIISNDTLDGLIATLKKMKPDNYGKGNIKTQINAFSVKFELSYEDIGNYYKSRGLSLNDKYITIEKRANTNYEDGIFYISSPYHSKEHNEIINHLEKTSK